MFLLCNRNIDINNVIELPHIIGNASPIAAARHSGRIA
jgi:hypothetical protein